MFEISLKRIFLVGTTVIQLIAILSTNSLAAYEWNEILCETGDQIPISLRGVWGSSSNDVFFVGDSGHVFHYDGSSCYTILDAQGSEIAMLYDVWGASGSNVFAVGGNYGEILHYDGNEWSGMRRTEEQQILYGVWGYSSHDVFAVGEGGLILRYDGEVWSEMKSETSWPLHGIWGSSPEDIFAVGHAGTVLHYDGNDWTSMFLGSEALGTVLYDVWGSAGNDVYVAGESGRYVNQRTGIMYHYNGSIWSQVMLDFSLNGLYLNGSLYGVWGSSDKNVFAVGGDLFGGGILHYDGGVWIEMESEVPSILFDIWGSSLTDIYAVGFGYRILHFSESSIITTSTSTSATTTTIRNSTTTTTTIRIVCPPELIYGEYSQETELLRRFRDTIVRTTPEGRQLIKLYYQLSPAIVSAMEEDQLFKEELREIMKGVLSMITGEIE